MLVRSYSMFLVLLATVTVISESAKLEDSFIREFALSQDSIRINLILDNKHKRNGIHRKLKNFQDIYIAVTFLQGMNVSGAVGEIQVLNVIWSENDNNFDKHDIDSFVQRSTKHDVFLVKVHNFEDVAKHFMSADLESNLFMFRVNEYDKIIIKEAYRIQPDWPPVILRFGSWTAENGLIVTKKNKYERRRDLMGLKLRTTVETWMPYMNVLQDELGQLYIEGFFAEVFHSLRDITNFTYSLVRPPDGNWGFELPNGSWSGMIGQINRGEADISPAGFVVLDQRRKAIDYLRGIFLSTGRLFFRNLNFNFNWFAYLSPLVWEVWATLILLMVLMPLVIALSANLPPQDEHVEEFSLAKSYIFVFGALTFIRRWSVTPETISTRVIFLMITLAGLLIQYQWKAVIISQLTVKEIRLPFHDLAGVLRSDYKLLIYPGGNLVTEFQTAANDTDMYALWHRDLKDNIDNFPNEYDALIEKATSNEGYAFLEYFEGPIPLSEAYRSCELVSTKTPLIPSVYTFILKKNATYAPLLNYYLDFLKEKGLFDKMAAYYRTNVADCGGGAGNPIDFNNIISAVSVFCSGLFLAMLLFVLEHLAKIGEVIA